MKASLVVPLILSVALGACSKSGTVDDGGLNGKAEADPPPPPRYWQAQDKQTKITHIVSLDSSGNYSYRMEREVRSYQFQPRDPSEFDPQSKPRYQMLSVYTTYGLVEESSRSASDCPSVLGDECLSAANFKALQAQLPARDESGFEFNKLKFSRMDPADLPATAAHGFFDKVEKSLVFRPKTRSFDIETGLEGPYDYTVSLHKSSPPPFVAVRTGDQIEIRPFSEELTGLRNARVLILQAYAPNAEGELVPASEPEELYLPTFKVNPDDFKAKFNFDPSKAQLSEIRDGTIEIDLPFIRERFEPYQTVGGMEQIIEKRAGYLGSLSFKDETVTGKNHLSATTYRAVQGSTITVYLDLGKDWRTFDREMVQIYSAVLPLYQVQASQISFDCDTDSDGVVISATLPAEAKLRFSYQRDLDIHGKGKIETVVLPWEGPAKKFAWHLPVGRDGFSPDKKIMARSFDLEYTDAFTGGIAKVGFLGSPWISAICHKE